VPAADLYWPNAATGRHYDGMAEPEPVTADAPLGKVSTPAGTVVLEQRDGAAVLRVTGALDLALAPRFRQLFERALRLRPELVVADLTGVDFLASAGMAVLVQAHRQCPPPARLHLVAAGRLTIRPLEMTRLVDELTIFPSLSAALAVP
jgi:anti-sigma B factor antagonist